MKRLLTLANEMENFFDKVNKIKSGDMYSEKYKEQEIEKAEKNFTKYADNIFNKIEKDLDKQAEKSKEKLQELQIDDDAKRQYLYNKAVNELSNYDDPAEYLKDKKELAESEAEMLEAREVAKSKVRNSDQADYEQLKDVIVDTMSKEEKEARKELAKVDIKKQNLEGAKDSFEYDFKNKDKSKGEISYGNPDLIKSNLIAYSSEDNIEQKAEKKITETIK